MFKFLEKNLKDYYKIKNQLAKDLSINITKKEDVNLPTCRRFFFIRKCRKRLSKRQR